MTRYRPEIEICDASETDAEAIWELQRLAFHQQAVLYDDFHLPPLVQTLDDLRRDFAIHTVLKAMDEDKIVGSVRGMAEGSTCHVSRLIVHPAYQNRGIGKQLMFALEKKFSTVRRYELYTGHKSEKNLAFYAKLGYREFGRKSQSANVMLIMMEKKAV